MQKNLKKIKSCIFDRKPYISKKSVKEFIESCENCQRENPIPNQPLSISPIMPSYNKERLLVDLIDLSCYSESNEGYKYLYTFIDSFSKFGWVYKSKSKSGKKFSEILEKHLSIEGKWRLFHTDNGREFVNRDVDEVLKYFNIERVAGRPDHPQSQGQIERFNKMLKSRLRKSMGTRSFQCIKIFFS